VNLSGSPGIPSAANPPGPDGTRHRPDELLDLIIVGGGPVGLLAGLLAHEAGLRFRVLERDPEPRPHSRAIGIHPPALRLLARLGFAEEFAAAGTRIRRGRGFGGPGVELGTLDFGLLRPPWNFILTLPQWRTEALFEERLHARAPGALFRGMTVTGLGGASGDASGETAVRVRAVGPEGAPKTLTSRFVLACDGKRSLLREGAGIGWRGGPYRSRYLMGDFPSLGPAHGPAALEEDAAIYLHPRGLVESFPVVSGVRRWVVQEDEETPTPGDLPSLVAAVEERCGVTLDSRACRMFSAFGVERYLADRFWKGRLILTGDAAHVVSPIGGQGMNLGWLNADEAVTALARVLRGETSPQEALGRFERRARRRAREVIRRAEQNMFMGNRRRLPRLRNQVFRLVLRTPLRKVLARRFSMHGL
jgi:2-polyprenyl-6-methoxyphenol hydroxylase-like FAD-dependent oxidoreductase